MKLRWLWTAWAPVTATWRPRPLRRACFVRAFATAVAGVPTFTTFAPAGGEIENDAGRTGPYVIPVALSSITGLESPCA